MSNENHIIYRVARLGQAAWLETRNQKIAERECEIANRTVSPGHQVFKIEKPIPVTSRNITDAQIRALREEAANAGDFDMIRTCDQAIARRGGRGRCAAAINDARAAKYVG